VGGVSTDTHKNADVKSFQRPTTKRYIHGYPQKDISNARGIKSKDIQRPIIKIYPTPLIPIQFNSNSPRHINPFSYIHCAYSIEYNSNAENPTQFNINSE